MSEIDVPGWWCFGASVVLCSFGCTSERAPEQVPTEAVVAAQVEGTEAAQAPTAPERTHPNLPMVQGGRRAAMPRDAVHAGLGRGATPAGLPPSHPAIGGGRPRRPMAPTTPGASPPLEEGVDMPLTLEGPGSAAELTARLGRLPQGKPGEDVRRRIEEAFRLTFTGDRARRDVKRASELLQPICAAPDATATCERILGYVAVSSGFDVPRAFKHYGRAVELEPDYGEAHYALAFMHAMKDRTTGKTHYDRALSLGVPDTRGLARFYGAPGAPTPAKGH